ncbi:hypothetical protein M3M33_17595, partial [Loigolactobacillus coryniformis]|uniref:hypothetical protein n=1 Tax=Loigolactobacillus coryniformis TaxID=1610 RepID=UPI00201AF7F0
GVGFIDNSLMLFASLLVNLHRRSLHAELVGTRTVVHKLQLANSRFATVSQFNSSGQHVN